MDQPFPATRPLQKTGMKEEENPFEHVNSQMCPLDRGFTARSPPLWLLLRSFINPQHNPRSPTSICFAHTASPSAIPKRAAASLLAWAFVWSLVGFGFFFYTHAAWKMRSQKFPYFWIWKPSCKTQTMLLLCWFQSARSRWRNRLPRYYLCALNVLLQIEYFTSQYSNAQPQKSP